MYKLINNEIFFIDSDGSKQKLNLEEIVSDLNILRDSLNDLKERIKANE